MKLEKLSENQIRCIINRADLEEREIDLPELIQHSDKARALFQEMMEQAAVELDFEVNNFPLMVEAAPISTDSMMFVITRVDDPEQLKDKLPDMAGAHVNLNIQIQDDDGEVFHVDQDITMDDDMDLFDMDFDEEIIPFSDEDALEDEELSIPEDKEGESDKEKPVDILGLFHETIRKAKQEAAQKKKEKASQQEGFQVYCFERLSDVIALSGALAPFYDGESHLYKDPVDSTYYLALLQNDSETDLFTRACTIGSDYGHAIDAVQNSLAYFTEHFQAIRIGNAIDYLNELN